MSEVRVQAEVHADPDVVYGMVSDVTRMGEWSPETTSCRWIDGAGPAVGGRFRGANRHGFRRWSTTCTVTTAEPGRCFAFSVGWSSVPVAEWSYAITPTEGGCTVAESWVDRRPWWLRTASVPAMGVRDRTAHNRAGMLATLAALKLAAESG